MHNGPFPGNGNPGNYQPDPQGQQWPGQQPGNQPYPGISPSPQQSQQQPPQQWGVQNYGYPPPKKKSGLIVGIVIGLVVLIGLGVGGFFLFKGDDKPSANPAPKATPAPSTSSSDKPATEGLGVAENELMRKIRASGPCEMHDMPTVQKYGPSTETDVAGNIGTCRARAVTLQEGSDTKIDQTKPITLFSLNLGELYTKESPAETVGNHQVFLNPLPPDIAEVDACEYFLLFPDTKFGALLRARKYIPGQASVRTEWPERCATAKEYLGIIADKVLALAPRQTPPTQPSLSTKDPCLKKDEIISQQLPGWKMDTSLSEGLYISPYRCNIKLINPNENYTLDLDVTYEKHEAPTKGEKISIGGLTGIRNNLLNYGLTDTLIYRPADADDKLSAQTISVQLSRRTKLGPNEKPTDKRPPEIPVASDLLDRITEIVVNGAK